MVSYYEILKRLVFLLLLEENWNVGNSFVFNISDVILLFFFVLERKKFRNGNFNKIYYFGYKKLEI